jgi:hypothetical protein
VLSNQSDISWNQFKSEISRVFGNHLAQSSAVQKIKSLYQGNKSISEYIGNFRQIINDLDFSDSALRAEFMKGLSAQILDMMLNCDPPASLEQAMSVALSCETRLLERKNLKKPLPYPFFNDSQSGITNSKRSDDGQMEIDFLENGRLSNA